MIWSVTEGPALFYTHFNNKHKRYAEVSSALNGALIGKFALIMLHFHKESNIENIQPPFSVSASNSVIQRHFPFH
jgi:hypothetical protein